MNGSLAAGNCSDISIAGSATVCRQPASSFLFDGKTPTLTGLSDNMWASQLFTAAAVDGGRSILLTFEFDSPEYTGVWGVEVTMFNCPDWGLAVQSIRLQNSGGESVLSSSRVLNSSCTSLVTVMLCSQSRFTSSESRLLFDLQPNSDRVYIAELTFFPTVAICETADRPFPLEDTTVPLQPAGIALQGTTRAITTPVTVSTTMQINRQEDLNTTTPTDVFTDVPTSTIILAAVLTGVLIAFCLLAAVLILWICNYLKHHKHNTSHHPAVEEGLEYEEVDGRVGYAAETGTAEGWEGQVGGGGGGVIVSDPTYMEVGGGGGGVKTFHLKENEAYAGGNDFQLKENEAYASYR